MFSTLRTLTIAVALVTLVAVSPQGRQQPLPQKPAPEEGFRWMTKLASSDDEDVQWILRENSKKSRLVSKFPGRVERLRAIMRHG